MFQPTVKSLHNEDISILIQLDNHSKNYICECGEASDLTVKNCQNTYAIFISHTHIDHFVNFDTILRHQIGIGRRVIICGPQGIIEQVQAKIRAYNWNLIEAGAIEYEVRAIEEGQPIKRALLRPPLWGIETLESLPSGMIFQNERFKVTYTILDHKTPSIAYLFKEKDSVSIDLSGSDFKGGEWIRTLKNAFENSTPEESIIVGEQQYLAQDLFHLLKIKEGDSLGIIMDHGANEENHKKIKELFFACNKVLIESFYKIEDQVFAINNFHSYSKQSGEVMRACKVKEAIPVHFSRKYEKLEIEELILEFNKAFRNQKL